VNYGNVAAVKDISLAVGNNEIVALIGNNGAGKSTTLKAISGLIKPKSGEIWFNNKRIDRMPVHAVTALGIIHVPEGRKIFSKLTVLENLLIGAYLRKNRDSIEKDLLQVYELFPILKERLNQPGGTLSGGEQQMLAIGRALMAQPKVLLLDEPSLGLAPMIVERIAQTILEIKNRGIPILLIEQNAKVALELADRGYVMETGTIAMQGDADQLLNDETVRKLYLGVA
jgi:branched-chain amino acid transport system ATP-binding protein